MARSRSSRCQGARGHRVGASGSVLAQRGPQPAPQPGSAWLGARRAARSEQAGASAAAWRPPGPLPGHQKILATQGLCRTQASERFLPEKLPARSKKRQEEEEEAERRGAGTHQPASRGHRPRSSPWGRHRPRSPQRQQGRGASRGLRSAASRYQALQRAGALPGSAAAACPPGRVLLQGQELGPPKNPVPRGPLQGCGPSAGTQEHEAGVEGLQNCWGVGAAARAQRKV